MIQKGLRLIFGSKHERDVKNLLPIVEQINSFEAPLRRLSDQELSAKTVQFKEQLATGKGLDQILPEAFALVREASWRTLGLRHFDVQMMGGIVLHQGKIAEMKTGEGKTLTATTAVYLNALTGKGVHLVTVNDYLARRDAAWMKPVYNLLGITVGVVQHNMTAAERKAAYGADVTYGTNNEFGFDYLRDNMVTEAAYRVQRSFYFAIVDEVDSILIDEARTPLIISGPTEERVDQYVNIDHAIRHLCDAERKAPDPQHVEVEPGKEEPHVLRGYYYDIDEKSRNVFLTEEGIQKLEELLGVENLFALEHTELVAHANQALRAHLIFKNEVDYVVQNGEVIIVDEHTGRTMPGRRYSDGLHQALEAKERVEVKRESQTLASITFQNFFRMYEKLAGMTGTADTEAEEFKKIYQLDVVVVPTNMPIARSDSPDRVYCTEKAKYEAITEEISGCVERGQPVLVGTISIEKSEYLSTCLKKAGIAHNILNAKQHAREAEIVANAGRASMVTVATNMAGRGTDIVLGGAPQYLAMLDKLNKPDKPDKLSKPDRSGKLGEPNKLDKPSEPNKPGKPSETNRSVETDRPEDLQKAEEVGQKFHSAILKKRFPEAQQLIEEVEGLAHRQLFKDIYDGSQIWLQEHKKVCDAGGLHILGTERHEARRIDNQLRGRSGRQGDPGSSRFYLSLEDHLMRIFGGERIKNLMGRLGMDDDQELEAGMVDRAIARAQKRVENHNFDIRKHLLEYDEVMNRQRQFVYQERNLLLDNKEVREHLLAWAEEAIETQIMHFCETGDVTSWDVAGLEEWLQKGLGLKMEIFVDDFSAIRNPQLALLEHIWTEAKKHYLAKVSLVGEQAFNYVERRIAIDVIDARWKEHLYTMDHLREGVWASGYAERNPLVEFKLEGFRLFDTMVQSIKEQITEYLFRVRIEGPLKPSENGEEDEVAEGGRMQGVAHHESLNSFSRQDGKGSREKRPLATAAASSSVPSAPMPTVSGGSSSRRRGSRRRRRR